MFPAISEGETTSLINCMICRDGQLQAGSLHFNTTTGLIVDGPSDMPESVQDMKGHIVAPAFLELQINGCTGFHFTIFQGPDEYQENPQNVSAYLKTTGVGSFWATIPTVSSEIFQKVKAVRNKSLPVCSSDLPSRRG